jgi:hypothetical protein
MFFWALISALQICMGLLNILIIRIFLVEPPKFIKAVFCHAKAFPAPAGPSLKLREGISPFFSVQSLYVAEL